MRDRPQIGEFFVCPNCGQLDVVEKGHEEMVALYEVLFGKEFDEDDPDLVMVCDPCSVKLHEEYRCGQSSPPGSPSSPGGVSSGNGTASSGG